jgi:hypothetical protein
MAALMFQKGRRPGNPHTPNQLEQWRKTALRPGQCINMARIVKRTVRLAGAKSFDNLIA